MYNFDAPFRLFHADVGNLEFLGKNATFPQYVLVLVDLFSSKLYTYPMKSRKKIRQKLEQFYKEVKGKRQGKKMYNAIPTKSYIKESYFLYDKSNLIKKTFVTAINKQLSLYGSFSYFSGKTTVTNLKLINSSDFLKFFIEKRSLKNNISLQLLNVNGSAVKTSDKKIHDFSITKLGKKRKNSMREPIETIIIRVSKILKL